MRDDLSNVSDDTVIGKDLITCLNIDTSTCIVYIIASYCYKSRYRIFLPTTLTVMLALPVQPSVS